MPTKLVIKINDHFQLPAHIKVWIEGGEKISSLDLSLLIGQIWSRERGMWGMGLVAPMLYQGLKFVPLICTFILY